MLKQYFIQNLIIFFSFNNFKLINDVSDPYLDLWIEVRQEYAKAYGYLAKVYGSRFPQKSFDPGSGTSLWIQVPPKVKGSRFQLKSLDPGSS